MASSARRALRAYYDRLDAATHPDAGAAFAAA
jgi:hypothetical protein